MYHFITDELMIWSISWYWCGLPVYKEFFRCNHREDIGLRLCVGCAMIQVEGTDLIFACRLDVLLLD